jgi:hypothetical protein
MLHLQDKINELSRQCVQQTDFIIVMGPAREVSKVFVFQLTAERFCPEDIASIPSLPSLTAVFIL